MDIQGGIQKDVQKNIQKDIHMDMHRGSRVKSWDPEQTLVENQDVAKISIMSAYVLSPSIYTSAIIMTCRWDSNPCHQTRDQSYNLTFLPLDQYCWTSAVCNSVYGKPLHLSSGPQPSSPLHLYYYNTAGPAPAGAAHTWPVILLTTDQRTVSY